jgi:soluble cytochrome b562
VAALDDERDCLEAERAAFTQFRKRVAGMDVSESAMPTATTKVKNAIMGTSETSTSAAQIEQVRNAYHETIMSVPHYEDDYDQSLDTDLAEEFGPELANALATTDSLTPPLHETVLTASQQATEGRTTLLSALDREADDLQQVRDTLETMHTTLTKMNQRPITAWATNKIISTYEQLVEFETQCDELAAERQAELHSRRVPRPIHANEEFNEYLYESLPVTYPVLVDLAEFDSLLQTARQHLEQALITR